MKEALCPPPSIDGYVLDIHLRCDLRDGNVLILGGSPEQRGAMIMALAAAIQKIVSTPTQMIVEHKNGDTN